VQLYANLISTCSCFISYFKEPLHVTYSDLSFDSAIRRVFELRKLLQDLGTIWPDHLNVIVSYDRINSVDDLNIRKYLPRKVNIKGVI
jgi:hypothetical protein